MTRFKPWTSAVTLPHRRNGLSARRMAVLYTFGKPVLRRHVHCAFMRSALLDMPPIMPTTACHPRNDVERYRRYSIEDGENGAGRGGRHVRHGLCDGVGRSVAAVPSVLSPPCGRGRHPLGASRVPLPPCHVGPGHHDPRRFTWVWSKPAIVE